MKKLKLLGIGICGMWILVAASYAIQIQNGLEKGEKPELIPLQSTGCASSSGTSGGE